MNCFHWKKNLAVIVAASLPFLAMAMPLRILPLSVSGYTGTETLTDFPVLVRLSEQIEGFSYANCRPDGADVTFTLEDGTPLSREIDTWNPEGESLIWVRLPSLGQGTTFQCRYDDASITDQPACQTDGSVWKPSGYIAVWHMDEVDAKDSTGLGNDGVVQVGGTLADHQLVFGKIGSGFDFDGATTIDCGTGLDPEFAASMTVEGWACPSDTMGFRGMLGKDRCFAPKFANGDYIFTTPGISDHRFKVKLTAGVWSYVAFTFLPSTPQGAKAYENGRQTEARSASRMDAPGGSSHLNIGGSQARSEFFKGVLDEIRISKVIRSDDWILGCHETMSSPSFLTPGNVLFVGGNALQVSAEPFEIGAVTPSYGLHLEYPAGTVIACSAPPAVTNEAKGFIARCTGWRLHDSEGMVVASGPGTSCSYTQDGGYGRLAWLFDISYRMEGTAEGGTVTGFEPWAPIGSTQSFLAEPADPTMVFRHWEGDVPAGREGENPLSLVAEGPLSVKAVFTPRQTRKWTGAGGDALASNGANWEGGVAPVMGDDVLLDATGTDHPMIWDLDLPVNSWTQEGYTNIVTIATVFGDEGLTALRIGGDCLIQDGIWTHKENNNSNEFRLYARIGGNLTIGPRAVIHADRKGCKQSKRLPGMGTVTLQSGGAYAAQAGVGRNWFRDYQPTYGSPYAPEDIGSGGSWNRSEAGGAIRLDIAGALVHDGTISASSIDIDHYSGSGGSVYIRAGSLQGAGTIQAKAGNANGAGSGGRIAIILAQPGADFSRYDLVTKVSAQGGVKKNSVTGGGSGTIYAETAQDEPGHGWLVMRGNGTASNFPDDVLSQILPGEGTMDFSRLTLTNCAIVRLLPGQVLDLSRTVVEADDKDGIFNGFHMGGGRIIGKSEGPTAMACGIIAFAGPELLIDTPALEFSGHAVVEVRTNLLIRSDLSLSDGAELWLHKPLAVEGDVVLGAGATAHGDGPFQANPVPFDLTASGTLTIAEGAVVDMDGRGFVASKGPGRATRQSGGSHGGLSGSPPGTAIMTDVVYGSICDPLTAGSGGASTAGGGIVRLRAGGAFVLDGMVQVKGAPFAPNYKYYGGAGGSINVEAASISGSGTLDASGFDGLFNYGGGGGGRIAVALSGAEATFEPFTGTIKAYGSRSSSKPWGGAGTVYLREKGQGPHEGCLLIDNGDATSSRRTPISPDVVDAIVGDVSILPGTIFALEEDSVLSVSGDFSNEGAFEADGRSTVDFTGTAPTVLSGDSTFCTLSSSAAGKTILFSAGSTQSVTGRLALAGEGDGKIVLRSTAEGSPWKLAVTGVSSVSDVDVSDSDASVGETIAAINSVDGGNNVNWTFTDVVAGETVTWTGSKSSSWNDGANWAPTRVPLASDNVSVPSGTARTPRLEASAGIASLAIAAGASLALDGHDLEVDGSLQVGGSLAASADETIRVGGDLFLAAFTAADSCVVLDGTGRQSFSAPGVLLSSLVVENGSGVVFNSSCGFGRLRCGDGRKGHDLAFAPGVTISAGQIRLAGDPATANLVLRSSLPGQRWHLNGSDCAISGVTVSDSDATSGVEIFPVDSIDGGNNLGWSFSDTRKRWTGAVDKDFANSANWAGGIAPTAEDDLYIAGGDVEVTAEASIGSLTIGPGTRFTIDAPVTVARSVVIEKDGTVVWNVPGTIEGNLTLVSGATMTHDPNGKGTDDHGIDLVVRGNGFLAPGATIDVTGKGYARSSGPGYNGNTGSSHGGRGARGTTDCAPCYGSIVCPTNSGTGGHWGNTPGGGIVRLAFDGSFDLSGSIHANGIGVDPFDSYKGNYNGAGGSVNLSASGLTGSGQVTANGGEYGDGAGALSGGGRIALRLTDPSASFATFSGLLEVCGGRRPDRVQRAAPGTIYTETAAQKGGRGTVTIAGGDIQLARAQTMTDFPPLVRCEEGETEKTTVVVEDSGVLHLVADTTVEDIDLEGADSLLRLNGHTLTVRSKPHALGLDEQNQVTYADGGQVLWVPRGGPTLLMIR